MTFAEILRQALDNHRPHGSPGYDGKRPAGRGTAHPMDTMLARGQVSNEEYLCACKFRADYEIASSADGRTADWSTIELYAVDDKEGGRMRSAKRVAKPASGPGHVVDAKRDLQATYEAVGPLGFQILRAVAVMGIPLVHIAGHLKVHRDIAAFRFREALQSLVQHYKDIA